MFIYNHRVDARTVIDLRTVPFYKFLFSPRGWYFDASAKQPPTQVRHGMPIKRLRNFRSRYISWGECHFNIVRSHIKQKLLFLENATINSHESKFHVFARVSSFTLYSLK